MKIKANYVDILNRNIFPASIEVKDKKIASVVAIDEALSTYILPGFIDAHIHIESSMLIPSQFARLASLHGTVATVSDPHEIANVLGRDGIDFMLKNASQVAFKFYFGASPCVPATPFETSGATLDVADIKELLSNPEIKFLSEVMNFPGVLNNDTEIMAKIELAKHLNKPIDGHAPALRGDDLKRYIDAGISTDHEAFSYEEAKEKLDCGMKILIREGSAAKNFEDLAPLIDEYYQNMMFCSDDRHPNDLEKEHINALVIRALEKGNDLFKVLQMACINPIKHYKLDVGSLHVGDAADFIEVENLSDFRLIQCVINGEVLARKSHSLIPSFLVEPVNNFHAQLKSVEDFAFKQECDAIEVIHAHDHELITDEKLLHLPNHEGNFSSDIERDILKITVINRYENVAPYVAFVHGFGLKSGAIASSVAHDSHNIIALGCSDEAITEAVNLVIKNRGGVSAVNETDSHVLALEVAGLMSSHDGFEISKSYSELDNFSKEVLGSSLSAPFMTLSFMALLVIPSLKISDKGLFDSNAFHFIHRCKNKE
ncbi:MAG: adenine deaminase [Campylobacterota bacterium]|nr:adenine deaminase [Campylobacterota bacterium]